MAPAKSLPVRARRLVTQLRRLREAAGLSVEQAAAQLGWSYSKLNRFELGRTIPGPEVVAQILRLYGVEGDRHESLVELAREAHERGWWETLGVFTGNYVGLEDEASHLRLWRPLLIPGLLQIEDYSRALIEDWLGANRSPAEVEKRVRARIARQTLLSRPDPPRFHAVLGEAALRQEVGGEEVLNEQLRRVLDVAGRRPNVTIQVLPFTVGACVGLDGAFTHLEFSEPMDPDISYIEDLSGEQYIESTAGNQRLRLAFDRISGQALSPEESVKMIAGLV